MELVGLLPSSCQERCLISIKLDVVDRDYGMD